MIIDIFLILVILASLSVLIKILVSKFPILSNIKIEHIHKEKEKNVKNKILEKRFLDGFNKSRVKKLLQNFFNTCCQKIVNKINYLEENYLEKYNKMVKEKPQEVEKRINLVFQEGEKKLEENNLQEAENKFMEVLSFDPRNPAAFKNLLKIYLSQKKYSLALKTAKHILKLNEQAIKWWENFKKRQEKIPEKLTNELVLSLIDVGYIYQEIDDCGQAIKYFEKAIKYNPNNPRILDLLIENSIILDKKDKAIGYLEKIKEINPENQKIAEWQKKIKNMPM
jgi:tetratricopeptide (TPR) repeat protein